MPVDLGSIEFWAGPDDIGAPDSLQQPIVDFIGGARQTLDIAVQELESRPIAEAILAARVHREHPVRVRMVLEHDYLTVRRAVRDPWIGPGQHEENRSIYAMCLRARIGVRSDLNPEIFHQKFIVRDVESNRAAVLTGSTNFTPTGLGSNLNHVTIIRGRRVARLFAEEFEEIWTGTFGTKRERHEGPPREYSVSGVRVKTLFAPDHAPEMELMKQMLKARRRIDFAMFTFARSSGIDDTLVALSQAGIRVRGVLDGLQGNQRWAATRHLAENGVEVFLARHDAGLNKLHHKLAVIDDEVVISGSFNYTAPATALNDENVVVIGDVDEQPGAGQDRQRQLGRYARLEIDRIIAMHGTRVV